MPLTHTYPEFTDIPREAVDDPEELYRYLSSLVLNLRELRGELAKVLTSDSTLYEIFANKAQADGYAELDGSGDVPDAQIPSLNTSKITAGTFDVARIPDLNASKITAGTFHVDRIPNLSADKITSGILNEARVPFEAPGPIGSGAASTGAFTTLGTSGNVTLSGAGSILSHDGTTDSSSTTTGSIHTDGGQGIVQKLFVGDDITCNERIKFDSVLGGLCIKLTNKTGGNTVKGNILAVDNSVSNDDSVVLAATGSDKPIGVFLDADVADGAEAWVVVSGIADVLADSNGWLNGDRVIMSMATTAGTGQASNTPVPSVHLTEIGHALEDATSALGRCILHFN